VLLTVPFVGFDRVATPEAARDARRRITAFAAEHGADRRLQADIALAVTEAVTNAIMHAYPLGHRGQVQVAADVEGGDLEIVVCDDGEGIQPGSSPGLGAGLSIITEVAHDFGVRERDPKGVEIWMRFHLHADD
jgi:anti-sigma regulatory factor (Ser/Thr protein kinase)